jgi:4-hydroxyphenylpyruvate dioxygenase
VELWFWAGTLAHASLAERAEVATLAGRPNGGVVFDTWHYLRGRRDDALLAAAAPELIMAVQVDDAAAEPVGSLLEDTWRHRRLPGDGDFDLATVLGILQGKAGVGPFGIEVLSEALWTLPPAEVGRRAGAALRRALS